MEKGGKEKIRKQVIKTRKIKQECTEEVEAGGGRGDGEGERGG